MKNFRNRSFGKFKIFLKNNFKKILFIYINILRYFYKNVLLNKESKNFLY